MNEHDMNTQHLGFDLEAAALTDIPLGTPLTQQMATDGSAALVPYQGNELVLAPHEDAAFDVLVDVARKRAEQAQAESLYATSRAQYALEMHTAMLVTAYNTSMRRADPPTPELCVPLDGSDMTEAQRTAFQAWLQTQEAWRVKSPVGPVQLMEAALMKQAELQAHVERDLRALYYDVPPFEVTIIEEPV